LAALTVAVGAILGIRGAVTSAATPGPRAGQHVYVVRAGDTLWSIATSHYAGDPRGNVWRLERRNHVLDTTLVPGQRLLLP
jgi:nucleoid-associated protein YgaU